MPRIAVLPALGLFLAACAHITPRDNPPDMTFAVSGGIDAASACMVSQFDRMAPGYAHFAAVIVPGKVYEVRPGKEATLTAELYFARIAGNADGSATVQVYAISTWAGKVTRYAEACKTAT